MLETGRRGEGGGDEGMKGWLTCLHKCVLTLSKRGTKRRCPLDRCLLFWGKGVREGADILSASQHLNVFGGVFSPPTNAVVTGPGWQLQGMETGMIPKQETVTVCNLYVTIPKGRVGQEIPSSHLAKSGLTGKAARLPGGGDSPPVLRPSSPCLNRSGRRGAGTC